MINFHSTTIVAVKTGDGIAMAGDGQVTMGETTIMKGTAKKVRRLYNGKVIAGFAGSVADAFILFDKFENHLEQCHGQLARAAVELAKEWRSEKAVRNLEALLLLADENDLFLVSGNGEVIVPDEGIAAIGSAVLLIKGTVFSAVLFSAGGTIDPRTTMGTIEKSAQKRLSSRLHGYGFHIF